MSMVFKTTNVYRIKRSFKLTLMFVFFAFPCMVFANSFENIKKRGYIKVSTSADYPPLSYIESGEIFGIEPDISKKIAENLGLDLKIINVSYDVLLLELLNSKFDFAIAAMSSSSEREISVDFSIPYLNSKQQIIVKQDSKLEEPNDLKSKKIGVQNGSSAYEYCKTNFECSNVISYAKPTEAVMNLINGQLDAVILNDMPSEKLVENYKEKIRILSKPLFLEDYRIAVTKGNTELLNVINREIETLKSTGEIQKIVEKYKFDPEKKINEFYNSLIYKNRYIDILKGLGITFQISIVSLIMGVLIGLLFCYIKICPNKKVTFSVLSRVIDSYVSIMRGTPLLVQLFFMYYLVLSPLGMNGILVSMIVFGMNSGAYLTESMRAGFNAIDTGQMEAGLSLGLNYNIVMKKILLPQAFRNCLPSLCNEFVSLVKETSIVSFIGVVDLTKAADLISNQTYQPFFPIVTTAILYFCISVIIVSIMRKLERKLIYDTKNK